MDTYDRFNRVYRKIQKELKVILSISLGVFLFILFFQPFTLDKFEFNDRLLLVAGLWGILFIFMVLIRLVFLKYIHLVPDGFHEPILPSHISGILILVLSTVAFTFYLRYVGSVRITFFIEAKIILICAVPPWILGIYDMVRELRQQNELLRADQKRLSKQIERAGDDHLKEKIVYFPENSAYKHNILATDVVLIKSADNYVEIIHKDAEKFRKKLVRSTLKNLEYQVKQLTNFVRCHRTCIVNIDYAERLDRENNRYFLGINGYDEPVPVSRQYILRVREKFSSHRGE